MSAKDQDLKPERENGKGEFLTTNQGLKVNDDQNTLTAGVRGPGLLEDFIMREKITHFDHERIPERAVHARGTAAHGFFQVYEDLSALTKAKFLCDPSVKTPVFVRFSTVVGSRGSSDTARDVRGFATKFYTEEGNFDLVGNNIPVFFIQDGIKFPDLVHSAKPEPHNEVPQAATAHDSFWDFVGCNPESLHMIMWAMSDRAIPRSYRMMDGFGVHTFKLVNAKGEVHFVKFHWKPVLGAHSFIWDESLKLMGMDPDFHRKDLYEAIENGDFPEWELGLQIIDAKDETKFKGFDLLDATKLIPEELVPIRRVGKLTLNRTPDNFFAEVEQVAFCPGHLVPGIDFSNDPLLSGRLFSYLDTQLTRLGGPNFHEIPINRPVCPIHNFQRDGFHRQQINVGKVAYGPNLLQNNEPKQAKASQGGFVTASERIEPAAEKVRARSETFLDFYSQAALFFHSMSDTEQGHIIAALRFELSKLETDGVRTRVLYHLGQVDSTLANGVASYFGEDVPKTLDQPNLQVPADADPRSYQPKRFKQEIDKSPALSQMNQPQLAKTRKVAILVADGFDTKEVKTMNAALKEVGAMGKIVALHAGMIKGLHGDLKADFTVLTGPSVVFDAVYVPGGDDSVTALKRDGKAIQFVTEAFKHLKAITATSAGVQFIAATPISNFIDDGCVISPDGINNGVTKKFVELLAGHKFWKREAIADSIPA